MKKIETNMQKYLYTNRWINTVSLKICFFCASNVFIFWCPLYILCTKCLHFWCPLYFLYTKCLHFWCPLYFLCTKCLHFWCPLYICAPPLCQESQYFQGLDDLGIAQLPNFQHFGTSLLKCLRTVRRPLLYYKEGENC